MQLAPHGANEACEDKERHFTSEKANTVPTAVAKTVPDTLFFSFGLKVRASIQLDFTHLKKEPTRTPRLLSTSPGPARRGTAQPPQHSG